MALTKSNHFQTPQVIRCITMELSANRRYTSKLVLEDTTIVFQKTKGERAEKIKSIHATLSETRTWEIPAEEACYEGGDHTSPSWLPVSHLAPYECRSAFMYKVSPPCSSALLGPPVSRWVPSAVSRLVNYTLRQRNRRGPGGPRNSRHGSEADWKLLRNFNCTTGNAAITSIIFTVLPFVSPHWKDRFT